MKYVCSTNSGSTSFDIFIWIMAQQYNFVQTLYYCGET